MNPYPIVIRAAKEAMEAYQKGDGPHEELRLKVLDTDRFLVQESSGYHQLLKIFKKPEAPAPGGGLFGTYLPCYDNLKWRSRLHLREIRPSARLGMAGQALRPVSIKEPNPISLS